MAVPGETACRPVMPCGSGRWGQLPVDGASVYVDGAYGGGDSDGSAAKPWTTIGEAVTAAAPGALIAIAAGSYAEDVQITGKGVRLWGVCPDLVEIAGASGATVLITTGADGTEVGGVALTGAGAGVLLSGSQAVVVDRLWVHHTGDNGLDAEDGYGPTSLVVRDSLVEHAHDHGIIVHGSDVTIESTVVRDTQPAPSDSRFGRGISVQVGASGDAGRLTLRASLVERSYDIGLNITGSDATVDGTVVRDVLPRASDLAFGRGIQCQLHATTLAPATLTLRGSLVERSHQVGVFAASATVAVEDTVVRNTKPYPVDDTYGVGVAAEGSPVGDTRAVLTMVRSVVENNHDTGVAISGSDALLEAVVVRGTLPQPGDLMFGRGVSVSYQPVPPKHGVLVLRGSLVEQNHDVGVFAQGASATIDGTLVRDIMPQALDNKFGNGIGGQDRDGVRATLAVNASVIERTHDTGLFGFGTDITVFATAISDIASQVSNQLHGQGIAAQANPITGSRNTLDLRFSQVARTREAGVSIAGSDAAISHCAIVDTAPTAAGNFGDGVHVFVRGPTTAFIDATRIEGSGRAAMSNFGAFVSVGSTTMTCQSFDLEGEPWQAIPYVFEDRGNNYCGCPSADGVCLVESVGLSPPDPVSPIQ